LLHGEARSKRLAAAQAAIVEGKAFVPGRKSIHLRRPSTAVHAEALNENSRWTAALNLVSDLAALVQARAAPNDAVGVVHLGPRNNIKFQKKRCSGALMRIRWLCSSGLLTTLLLVCPASVIPQATSDQVVMQTGTHVVLVNVVAKDKHGKPVNDLSRDDFVLRDNGQEQKIALFALEKAGEPATEVSASPAQGTFTNRPSLAGVTVFLFDELNTQLADQEVAKKDFLRYLRGLPADSRVAVFVLGDSLALLHDFTQDMASLVAAMSKHPIG
jgi:hypothetical protein